MKKLLVIFAFFSLFIFASGVKSRAQVVKVKPHRATVVVVKPARAKPHHTWINAHWQWKKSTHSYVWVKGRYVKNRRGYSYTQGYWVSVPHRGYVWKPGRWSRF